MLTTMTMRLTEMIDQDNDDDNDEDDGTTKMTIVRAKTGQKKHSC